MHKILFFSFLFRVIMFIVITSRNSDAQYFFLQWLGISAQDENIDAGLTVFIHSIKGLHEYLVHNIYFQMTIII